MFPGGWWVHVTPFTPASGCTWTFSEGRWWGGVEGTLGCSQFNCLTCLRPKLSLSGSWYLHYQVELGTFITKRMPLPCPMSTVKLKYNSDMTKALGRYAILSREGLSGTRAESRTKTCCSQTALKAQCEGVRCLPRQAQHWPRSPPTAPHQ